MKEIIPQLTGIRAVAAMMVYLHHFNPFKSCCGNSFLFQIVNELHVGVTVFFVLSGFLITYRYYNKSINLKQYFVNRVARIYPVYFILTTVLFLYWFLKFGQFSVSEFFLSISFLKGFSNEFKFIGIGPGWSLTVEECFYFSAPLLFVFIRKVKYAIALFPLFYFAIGLALIQFFGAMNMPFFESSIFMLNYTLFGRMSEFATGMAFGVFVLGHSSTKELKAGGVMTYSGMILGLIILYLMAIAGEKNGGISLNSYSGIFLNTIALPVFAIAPFFYGLIYERNIVTKITGSSLFTTLGKASYVFYLIHTIGKSYITNNYMNALVFVILNLCAILIFTYIEEPLNELVKKVLLPKNKNLRAIK